MVDVNPDSAEVYSPDNEGQEEAPFYLNKALSLAGDSSFIYFFAGQLKGQAIKGISDSMMKNWLIQSTQIYNKNPQAFLELQYFASNCINFFES